MTKAIGGVLVLAAVVWIWRQIGYLHLEQPLSEQKRASDIFQPTAKRYRITQRGKQTRSFAEWAKRYDYARKRA